MTRHPHLSDDQLAEVYLHSAPMEAERQHLERCGLCEARHADLAHLLAEVTVVARADADAACSPERLDRQKSAILGHIERDPHGRVISFPAGHTRTPEPIHGHPERRWIGGAAGAGLVIGLLGGHFAQDLPSLGTFPSQASQPVAVAPLQAGPPGTV